MAHGTADVSVLREGDLGAPRDVVLDTHGPVLVGGEAQVVISLHQLVLDGTASMDEVLTVGVAQDNSPALPRPNLKVELGGKDGLWFISYLSGADAHLPLQSGVAESVAQVAVLGDGQHVLAEGVGHTQRGVGVEGGAELVPPEKGRIILMNDYYSSTSTLSRPWLCSLRPPDSLPRSI